MISEKTPNIVKSHKKAKIDELEYLSVSSDSEMSSEPTDDIAEIQSNLKQIRSYIRLIDSTYL